MPAISTSIVFCERNSYVSTGLAELSKGTDESASGRVSSRAPSPGDLDIRHVISSPCFFAYHCSTSGHQKNFFDKSTCSARKFGVRPGQTLFSAIQENRV